MTHGPPPKLRLFNSLTRALEPFVPVRAGEARVYSCGPTVYNYQHLGNMRAYVFADLLGRTLSWAGHDLTHVVNITDVGHLTSDADAGDDKMERAAATSGKSAWEIARFYAEDFERDLARLNIRKPQHPRATDYVAAMIEWAKGIADDHCYELDSGLYFDVATLPRYGALAGAGSDEHEARIDAVEGKRHPQDFAIWRRTPAGETRQMEWDSPWGRGAPGWHLECSVMSEKLLGFPFDIHTGGIDHREIHHPNEIAQNQARCGTDHSGANIWMHNNFLIDRTGKMSKSSGDFLRLQLLVDKGVHPLAYRLMCLQAHYRSELEFGWDNLAAALTRLKRIVMGVERLREKAGATGADLSHPAVIALRDRFAAPMTDDLNSCPVVPVVEELLAAKKLDAGERWALLMEIDTVLGLQLATLTRKDLRVAPVDAAIDAQIIEARLDERAAAKKERDFARADAIRGELTEAGVEVMDGDDLRWEWKVML